MCNQVPSVTLQTAVLMQVKEFASNNQSFSVHDITRTIRHKTAQGELEIPEVEVSGASFRFDIPHAKVKALFDELWRTGVFDPDFTLSRQFNGMYFEYTPSPLAGSPTVQVSTPATAPVTQTVSTPAPVAPSAPATTSGPVPDSVVRDRIQTYLNNCTNKNFRPTLRTVQSAIKRDVSTGWSCEKIRDYIEDLGYDIVPDPDAISKAQVITV